MGNVEMHELEPVRADERKELDLSVPVDYKTYCKHVDGKPSSKCLTELPSALTESISLYERVNLSFNCLSTLPVDLPLRLPHISFLDLSYNRISKIPDSLGLLFHLKDLLLSHNCLEVLPQAITRLVKLQKIDVSHNVLQELPEKIGEMESLKKLNVSHNKLKSLPKSLGYSDTIKVILASSNCCVSQPPQNVCDGGSDQTIRFLKQLASGKILSKVEREVNIFPRVRGNVVQTAVPNSDSALAQYVQIQTETMNTASRIRTPLLPPYDATQLHPDELKDKVIGLIYGAVIGDALGIATEFLSQDECQFYYDEETLTYADTIRDEHRVHWAKGDWTSNSDQMLLVLDSLLQWAGVVDELEFAKRLVSWKKGSIPELGQRESYMFSTTINLVLQADNYSQNPHQVAQDIHKNDGMGQANGSSHMIKSPLFVDSGSLPRSLVLGIPRFHDLNEVTSNSVRICLATHQDERCVSACVSLSVAIALLLQGKFSVDDPSQTEELLKFSTQCGLNYIKDEGIQKEFIHYCTCSDFNSIGVSEIGKVCHPFKACATAFTALRQGKDFKQALTSLLMLGGYSSMTGCISGSLLGGKFGYSRLPKHWIEGLNLKNREWLNSKINALLDMMGLP
ncbi:p53-induced protein with a death, partial [Stegodyphus mimosarum]